MGRRRLRVTRWIVVLTKPAAASDEHGKKEAGMRLKNLWNRITRRDNDDGDDDDDNHDDDASRLLAGL